jgi:hypothetical protein
MVRRAALCAAARSGAAPLLDAVLKAQPDAHELSAWCIALGAFEGDAVVEALARTLKQNGTKGVDAVWSLARLATPAGNDVLKRAIDGEFGDVVVEAACLAVAPLVDEKRFVAGLRTAGRRGRGAERGRAADPRALRRRGRRGRRLEAARALEGAAPADARDAALRDARDADRAAPPRAEGAGAGGTLAPDPEDPEGDRAPDAADRAAA